MKRFFSDINYKQRGHTKNNRSKLIKRLSISIASPKKDSTSEDTVHDTNGEDEIEASGLSKADQCNSDHNVEHNNQWSCHVNGLVKRLELLILETKHGHDGLYDEMLKISKQILSMNIINKKQLDNLFLIMVKNKTTRHN